MGILGSSLLDKTGGLERLLRVRRAEERYTRWRSVASYQWFTRRTKSDPLWRAARRDNLEADRLEKSLLQSGRLVSVTFYLFGDARFNPQAQQCGAVHVWFNDERQFWHCYLGKKPPDQPAPNYARVGAPLYSRGWTVICPPQDVSFWQQEFCVMKNRILWQELRTAEGAEDGAGFSQDTQCLLPDHSMVTIFQCQKWLNENIAAGWRGGLMSSNLPNGDPIYVPFRAK